MPRRGEIYRSVYRQGHAERLQEDMARAEAELERIYETERARQEALLKRIQTEQELLSDLRKNLADLREQALKLPDKEEGGGRAGEGDILKAYVDLQKIVTDKRKADADRRVDLIEATNEKWNAPPAAIRSMTNLSANAEASLAGANTADEVRDVLDLQLSDPDVANAVATADTEEQQRDLAIKTVEGLVDRGVSLGIATQAVAGQFGLTPDKLDEAGFEADKEEALLQQERKAFTSAREAEGALKVLEGRLFGEGVEPDAEAEAQRFAEAREFFASEEGQILKQGILDDGVFNSADIPTALIDRLQAETPDVEENPMDLLQLATDRIMEQYRKYEPVVSRNPEAFGQSTRLSYDVGYLGGLQDIAKSEKRIGQMERRYQEIEPELPSAERIRERTREINQPRRRRTIDERVAGRPAPLGAGVPEGQQRGPNISDKQKVLRQAGAQAIRYLRDQDLIKDESISAKHAKTLQDQINTGALNRSDVYTKAVELAGDDKQLRDEIIMKSMAFDMQKKKNERPQDEE